MFNFKKIVSMSVMSPYSGSFLRGFPPPYSNCHPTAPEKELAKSQDRSLMPADLTEFIQLGVAQHVPPGNYNPTEAWQLFKAALLLRSGLILPKLKEAYTLDPTNVEIAYTYAIKMKELRADPEILLPNYDKPVFPLSRRDRERRDKEKAELQKSPTLKAIIARAIYAQMALPQPADQAVDIPMKLFVLASQIFGENDVELKIKCAEKSLELSPVDPSLSKASAIFDAGQLSLESAKSERQGNAERSQRLALGRHHMMAAIAMAEKFSVPRPQESFKIVLNSVMSLVDSMETSMLLLQKETDAYLRDVTRYFDDLRGKTTLLRESGEDLMKLYLGNAKLDLYIAKNTAVVDKKMAKEALKKCLAHSKDLLELSLISSTPSGFHRAGRSIPSIDLATANLIRNVVLILLQAAELNHDVVGSKKTTELMFDLLKWSYLTTPLSEESSVLKSSRPQSFALPPSSLCVHIKPLMDYLESIGFEKKIRSISEKSGRESLSDSSSPPARSAKVSDAYVASSSKEKIKYTKNEKSDSSDKKVKPGFKYAKHERIKIRAANLRARSEKTAQSFDYGRAASVAAKAMNKSDDLNTSAIQSVKGFLRMGRYNYRSITAAVARLHHEVHDGSPQSIYKYTKKVIHLIHHPRYACFYNMGGFNRLAFGIGVYTGRSDDGHYRAQWKSVYSYAMDRGFAGSSFRREVADFIDLVVRACPNPAIDRMIEGYQRYRS